MKFFLTREEFYTIAKGRKFGDDMLQALYMVLVQHHKYQEAADQTGVNVQMIGKNCRRLRQAYLESSAPEGWLTTKVSYPPSMQSDVDALLAKLEIMKIKQIRDQEQGPS
ncbi:TrfB-related DNA-binding protein [Zooshikella sp. RANM57]|uniref:TrfB-related DNA-binding protein n=1 Tax=Zooshikella sp. RANM57 TaxID=3425863 RepID=UPI003D6DC68B